MLSLPRSRRVETNDDMSYEDMHMEAVSKTDEEREFITKAIKKNEIFEQYAPPAGAARAARSSVHHHSHLHWRSARHTLTRLLRRLPSLACAV